MDEERPTTIKDLLDRHRRNTGDSFGAIANKTGLSKSVVGVLATVEGPRKVHPVTVDKLSEGLHLPRAIVEAAADETSNPTPAASDPMDQREREIVKIFRSVSPSARTALLEVAESIRAMDARESQEK